MIYRTEHERRAANTLAEIRKLQRYVENDGGNGTDARWPDVEVLLRLLGKEMARELEREGNRAQFAAMGAAALAETEAGA